MPYHTTHLRAELDAHYARLYGLTRDELRYILDSKEVHGEEFPAETFRVLVKRKDVQRFDLARIAQNFSFGCVGWSRARMNYDRR